MQRWAIVNVDRLVLSAAFVHLVVLSPPRAVAEGAFGRTDPSGATRTAMPEYDPTKPVPPGFHVEERSVSALVPVGSVVFGLSYAPLLYWGTSALAAGQSYSGCLANRWLVLPLAGPFIAASGYGGRASVYPGHPLESSRSAACANANGDTFDTAAGLRSDGALQVVGVVLIGVGLLPPWHVLVKDDLPGTTMSSARSRNGAHWGVVPWQVGTSAAGIDLVGTF